MLSVEHIHQLSILNKARSTLLKPDVEPFIDRPALGAMGSALSLGYRSAQTGAILATVTIPSALVANIIPLQVSAHLTFDGTITARAAFSDLHQEVPNNGFAEVSLSQLVEQM